MIVTNILLFVLYMLIIQFVIGFALGFTLAIMKYDQAAIISFVETINIPLVLISLAIPAILAGVAATRSRFFITRGEE